LTTATLTTKTSWLTTNVPAIERWKASQRPPSPRAAEPRRSCQIKASLR
jgi:hypothetical protein